MTNRTSADKYAVPALERAHAVLLELSGHPGGMRLTDLSRRLGVNKSSMFCLLKTMEALGWVEKSSDDVYTLGSALAAFGSSFFRGQALIDRFYRTAVETRDRLGETIQLARLEGADVFYLAKLEAPVPVRIASEPGMRFPAHATGLGKALLATLADDEVRKRLSDPLPRLTPATIGTVAELLEELADVRRQGVAFDREEAVVGFRCAAAPVFGLDGRAIAAVSVSMPRHHWEQKRDASVREIRTLADRLSARPRESAAAREEPTCRD